MRTIKRTANTKGAKASSVSKTRRVSVKSALKAARKRVKKAPVKRATKPKNPVSDLPAQHQHEELSLEQNQAVVPVEDKTEPMSPMNRKILKNKELVLARMEHQSFAYDLEKRSRYVQRKHVQREILRSIERSQEHDEQIGRKIASN